MNNYGVDRQKWSQLTIFEQMGNIYSEIGRTFSAKERGDLAGAEAAAVRAFDLFDATCEQLVVKKSPKLKEVLRSREQFATDFMEQENTHVDRYFMQFAIAARIQRK